MFYKFLTLFLFWGLFSLTSVANEAKVCSQEAIEKANNQYLQEISNHISDFSNENNNKAVQELSKIKPKESFRKRYEKEIKQLGRKGYQPPQVFCDDVYKNLDDLKQQIKTIVDKYDNPKKHTNITQ